MDYTHLPLIPAQAGIQVEGTSASPNLLGPRFRGNERKVRAVHWNVP